MDDDLDMENNDPNRLVIVETVVESEPLRLMLLLLVISQTNSMFAPMGATYCSPCLMRALAAIGVVVVIIAVFVLLFVGRELRCRRD